ncbi:MAG: VOC family protein [Phycisphaeraceae bacterium]|nr:VOC family protein [Phycisphaeraceae bacterium]
MIVQPYLYFEGRCEEALSFYENALGAETQMLLRYRDSPAPTPNIPPQLQNKIMHCNFRVGNTQLMASDGNCNGSPRFTGFSITLSTRDVAECERCFSALSEGGQVRVPLNKTFFSPSFGMVSDRFGVLWTVLVYQEAP